jgi:CheY-like chemotaxis protein/nitrogen-specific signal transduction histidine kinase
VAYLGIAYDITERKNAEAQLQLTNAKLARATHLKDEFLANMSHELRTPLNAIMGMAEGIQEQVFGPINERQQHALATIERSSSHLLSLINDILDLSKVEAGQMELDLSPTPISLLFQNSLAFVRQQALKKNIRIRTEIPGYAPDLMVDERRMNQVLINLLTNAVKFTPEGGQITLKVKLLSAIAAPHPAPAPTHLVRLMVIDTGIGIAPENIPKLFQPFVQIDGALNRKQAGTGLGLSLVKRIVELHGGEVGLTSEVGAGSCFRVDLPALNSVALPPPPAAATTDESAAAEHSLSLGSPLVLLAEDNEANLSTMSSYLRAKGYRLLIAKTGLQAIDQARTHQPDIILLDVQMPEMDGLEAMQHIRKDAELAKIPIIALTALAMKGDRDRCLKAGANHYLSKPVRLKELADQMQRLLAFG